MKEIWKLGPITLNTGIGSLQFLYITAVIRFQALTKGQNITDIQKVAELEMHEIIIAKNPNLDTKILCSRNHKQSNSHQNSQQEYD